MEQRKYLKDRILAASYSLESVRTILMKIADELPEENEDPRMTELIKRINELEDPTHPDEQLREA